MKEDIDDYKSPLSLLEIVFMILYDIGVFIAVSPVCIVNFYEAWQNDIVYMGITAYRPEVVCIYQGLLLYSLLVIVIECKNILTKLISCPIIMAVLLWITKVGYPSKRLEDTLLSPLKEQCYALLEAIPVTAIIYYLFLWVLVVFLCPVFDPQRTKANRIAMIIIWPFSLYIIPFFLRPFITMWIQ